MMRKALTIAALLSLAMVLSIETLAAAPLSQEPRCEITSPQANSQLRGSVDIVGTARLGPEFQFYKVEYASVATPEAWAVIGDTHDEQRTSERLETWYTTSLRDGSYYLRLVIVKKDGNHGAETDPIPVQIANMQPTATPVPAETTTPSPTIVLYTPTTAVVEQPTTVIRLTATPTREIAATPTAGPETPGRVSIPDLGVFVRQFVFGAFVAAAIFLFVGIVLLLRRFI